MKTYDYYKMYNVKLQTRNCLVIISMPLGLIKHGINMVIWTGNLPQLSK